MAWETSHARFGCILFPQTLIKALKVITPCVSPLLYGLEDDQGIVRGKLEAERAERLGASYFPDALLYLS